MTSKNEYLLRTRSVATNLLTSKEFKPIRCGTMLCHFSQLRNGSVASLIIHFSSTATSSAKSEYVTVLEHIGQNEEAASRIEERAENKPSLATKMHLNDGQWKNMYVFNV